MADKFGNTANLNIASGYPDLSGMDGCVDNMGFLETLDCETVFGSMVKPSGQKLLPDAASCNKPKVFFTIGTPSVKELVINGPLEAQTATLCKTEYNLGGFEYIRMKNDMLDPQINCMDKDLKAQLDSRIRVAIANNKDTSILCGLPALACKSNKGNNAGVSGIKLGTESSPVVVSRRLTPTNTAAVYILDYLQAGLQAIEEAGIANGMTAIIGSTPLKYAIRQSETFRSYQENGKGSSYDSGTGYCKDISLACDAHAYFPNCFGEIGKTGEGKSIYRIIWLKTGYFDMAHGIVLNEKGIRDSRSTTTYDTIITRTGWAVSHNEAIAIGYIIIE